MKNALPNLVTCMKNPSSLQERCPFTLKKNNSFVTKLLTMMSGQLQLHRYVSKQKDKPQHQLSIKSNHTGTYLPFVSAAGELVASYFIFRAAFDEKGNAYVIISLPSSFSRP